MAKHALDTVIASEYGVNIALLLENFQFWTAKNLQRNNHIYDGLCWTYDTLDALGEAFPYWSRRQIEHTINNAVKVGLLVKGNYNQTKYDRTLWYALTPKAYAYYLDLLDEKYLRRLYSSISQNCEMDYTKWRNGFPKNVTPIPDTDPDTDPDINISAWGKVLSMDYNDSDRLNEKNNKSDYSEHSLKTKKDEMEVIETEGESIKSDYFRNQIKNKTNSKSIIPYSFKNIQNENIFQIPEPIIQDWIVNRKKKRAAVTQTAWNKINKELAKCKEQGIDPIEAFETMVASGWQSLKVEYFEKQKKTSSFQWDVDSVMSA